LRKSRRALVNLYVNANTCHSLLTDSNNFNYKYLIRLTGYSGDMSEIYNPIYGRHDTAVKPSLAMSQVAVLEPIDVCYKICS